MSPSSEFRQSAGIKDYHEPEMFEEKQSYDEEGWPTSTQLGPKISAVPPENRAMVEQEDEERRRPWLMKKLREASSS